jgi:hypothetical protein
MSEMIRAIVNIGEPFNMLVLLMLIGTLGGVVATIAKQIRKWACHRQELEFKRELLDRGMGADDIERVVRARGPALDSESCRPAAYSQA